MSSFTNNGTFGTLFAQGDRAWSSYYTSTSRQQNAPIIGNSSCSELHWTGGHHRESYVPTNLASNTSSWPSTAFPDSTSSVYGGGVWPGDPHHDEPRHGSLFGTPSGNADRSGTNLMEIEVAAPVLEQAFPAAPGALSAFHPRSPPSLNWARTASPPWQPTSSWDHPVYAARQHNGHNSSIGSFPMRPENPPFQPATSSVITGCPERKFAPTGPLPSISSSTSVPSTLSDPVPVASSAPRSRGERWDFSNETTFQCSWTSRCAALVAGNRRSVTNHLRDEHNFACDDRVIVCAWGECTTYVQRRNVPRHIIACHFAIKVTCPRCGLALSRADANKKHRLACMGGKTPVVVEGMEEDDGGYFLRS